MKLQNNFQAFHQYHLLAALQQTSAHQLLVTNINALADAAIIKQIIHEFYLLQLFILGPRSTR